METRKSSIAASTILSFPNEIVTYRHDEEIVVVSPRDGNWLVISKDQLTILDELKSGKTIGDVLSAAPDKDRVLVLLKQILARNFTEKDLSVSDRTEKVLFYLTYDCNLQCEHCYMYAQRRKSDILSVAEYKAIFGELREHGVKEATFSGGEPLVRSDFWQIINAAHASGLGIKVFSNGTLWSDADIEMAKRYAIKAQISIDGVDEASCAAVRGEGVFDKAKLTALRLANAGIDVEIATTPMAKNIEAIEDGYADFVEELKEKSGHRIKFKVSQNLLPGRNVPTMLPSQKQDYGQRGVRLYSIANPGGTQIPFFDEYRNGRGRVACGLGRLVFTPDGFAYVCSRIDSFPALGNVREVAVPVLLAEARKRTVSASVDNTIPCRDCPLRHICGGGCRADRFEYVSCSDAEQSVHKPCSDMYKKTLVKMMVQATKECYTWS